MGGLSLLLASALAGFQPWGDAAFEQARAEQKPVLLAFGVCPGLTSDPLPDLAGSVVPVAVDGVERPDIADLYETASALLPDPRIDSAESTLYLLTPERRLFAALPCAPLEIVAARASEYREHRGDVEARAGTVLALMREAASGEPAQGPLDESVLARALSGLINAMDPARGGLRTTTPKGPPHGALLLLGEEQRRTGNRDALRLLKATLDAMARGGIHDPDAGFFVAAGADDWGEPEASKRLADNALLLRAYAEANTAVGDVRWRQVADEIASFCVKELRDADGSFVAGKGSAEGRPSLDRRVIAGWNGLMISGLVASGRKDDLAAAEKAATAVLQRLGPAALLRRFARGEELGGSALLEDYAFLAEGLLDLGSATGESRWNEEAASLVGVAASRFLDADHGGFFDTDERHGMLPVRIRNGYDGALPSGNGVMASALLKLSRATGEARYSAMARRTIEGFLGDLQKAPRGLETLAAAAGEMLGPGAPAVSPDTALPSRVVKGSVTVEAALSAPRVKAGDALDARVVLTIAPGHRVNARTAGKDLFGLSVSVPGEDFVASAPRYPEGLSPYTGTVTVTVPLRVRRGRPPGEGRIRVRVLFQACDAIDCLAPDSALLEVPVTILAPGR